MDNNMNNNYGDRKPDEQSYEQNQFNNNPYNQEHYNQNPYGQEQYGYNQNNPYNQIPEKRSNAMGITSLVLGILTIILACCCTCFGIPTGIAAVIFGIVSIKKHEPEKGFAIAGIIVGAVGLVFAIVSIIIALYMTETGAYDAFMNEFMKEYQKQLQMNQ